MKQLHTSVGKDGRFIVGVHKPSFDVINFRKQDYIQALGQLEDGTIVENHANFPAEDIHEPGADIIYEIANAFPFRGVSYINSAWADAKAARPDTIGIPKPAPALFYKNLLIARIKPIFLIFCPILLNWLWPRPPQIRRSWLFWPISPAELFWIQTQKRQQVLAIKKITRAE